jgi:hypothetical protein
MLSHDISRLHAAAPDSHGGETGAAAAWGELDQLVVVCNICLSSARAD